MGKPIFTFG